MLLETICCVDGTARNLSYHQNRLDHSLKYLGIPHRFDLVSLITPPVDGLYRCRFVYGDSDYSIDYIPYCPRPIVSLKPVNADHLEYSLKYTDRENLNSLFELRGECDDVLIVRNGYLTDTTIANIALYIDNKWITPQSPLLEGTTRARLLDEGFLSTAPLRLSDVPRASKVAIFNAMIGFVEVDDGIII